MNISGLLRAGFALVCTGFALSATALPITYNFEGMATGGTFVGQTLQGSFTFDVSLMPTPALGNDSTFNQFSGQQPAGQPAPVTAAVTFSGGQFFSLGGGTAFNDGSVVVRKNDCLGISCSSRIDSYGVSGRSVDLDSAALLFRLFVTDFNLADGPGIFPDATAGLDLTQPVNWLANGASVTGIVGLGTDLGFGTTSLGGPYADFTLTSITPVPEPEIYAMLAAGLGLMGWVGRRKKLKESAAA